MHLHLFDRPQPFWHKKKVWIPLGFLALLIALRIIIPPIALKTINSHLAKDSPYFEGHVSELDVSILRAAVGLHGITARVKDDNREFLKLKQVDASLAWKEIFKGNFTTEIFISGLNFMFYKELPGLMKKEMALHPQDKNKPKEKSPVDIDKVVIKDSNIILEDYPSVKPGQKLAISNIDGTFRNLTPKSKEALSFFDLKAKTLGDAAVKVAGNMRLNAEPMEWTLDSEVQGFDLTSLNAFLKAKVPLTFTHGKVDMYAEAQSEHGKIRGYMKPFIEKLDVIRSKEHFKNTKHWAVEIISAISNLVLRAPNAQKSVATKIPFTYDGKVHVDTGEALDKVLKNGFEQQLSPGIDDNFTLK